MTSRILFVCLGNICRSPTAEAVMRHHRPDLEIDSAGTGDWHVGAPPYGPMQEAAARRGYDLSALRARHFTPADFDLFDLIVVMDAENRAAVERQRANGQATPVRLFTEFAPAAGMDQVPDPYYTRDFDGALDLIEEAAQGLSRALT
ncbi:low molecular weight protein-tyrosine-phosphatase [Thalassococcus sp. S3]|uniref:low molecular weight protein-tyrosine-phosphatase n=1 Tax=Thalassococcus sp. S3 TaxID=2017482 RepID=UPI0010243515|nr:low molecular weight protein-tyrosine-phosphatase [Thalassococcus sp. S3]QBF31019.1 phosphotyrosine protein phosphatase [Thalassococcus sp. S3]